MSPITVTAASQRWQCVNHDSPAVPPTRPCEWAVRSGNTPNGPTCDVIRHGTVPTAPRSTEQ